jgi:hypothetical protein
MLSSNFIRFPVRAYDIGDKFEWRAWRRQAVDFMRCSTASMLSSYFGHHYSSFNTTVNDMRNDKQSNVFAAKAMKHGEDTEDAAKLAYLTIDTEVVVCNNGEASYITGFVEYGGGPSPPSFIMTTPDMVIRRGKTTEIVEFKCPYFEIFTSKLRKNRTIKQIVLDYFEKHPMGKESSFLQASVYALCEPGTSIINVVYYFTDTTDDAGMIVYTYNTSQVYEFDGMIIRAAARVSHELGLPEGGSKYRTSSSDKKWLTAAMCNAFYSHSMFIKDEHNQWIRLKEEASDYSEGDGPEIPREESGGDL